ncbi:MAG: T9SS type A sorting domain-containing protein [Saprospiraceae bacterium]|nr:T9SS type A sorting domain-containing protein [Saprospiraceae bacterium]
MIDSSSLSVQFDKFSWFADNSPTLQMYKQPKEGNIHTAFTRTASIVEDEVEGFKPVGVAGNGIIGRILFIVEDEVEGFKTNDNFITRRISTNGIEVQDADGERYIVPDTYVDVRINLNKKEIQPTEDKLIVYPNPARDNVLLHFNGRNEIKAYRIYDQMGMLINNTEDINAQSTQFNTNNYLPGIYMLQVVTTQGTISKKLIVSPK